MDGHESNPSPEVLLEHAAWVRRLAGELVRDPWVAEDVAQETWLTFLRRRPSLERPLRPWLATVTRRHAALWARGGRHRRAREEAAARGELVPSSDELVERAEVQRRLVEAVLRLEEPYRGAVLLRYFEGLTPARIAALRGVPAATVRTHLFRGLEKLRGALDAEHGGDRRAWSALLLPLVDESRAAALAGSAVPAAGLLVGVAAAVLAAFGLTWIGMRALWPGGAAPPVAPTPVAGAMDPAPPHPVAAAGPRAHLQRTALEIGAATGHVPWLLVDAEDRPLPDYLLAGAGGPWTSDAAGRVELPRNTTTVIPVDHAHLAREVRTAHSRFERKTIERAPIELPAGDGPQRLAVPAGPTFELELTIPAALDPSELEARLLAASGPMSLPRELAPVRPPGEAALHPWVRFAADSGGADDPDLRWILEVRDRIGLWRGRSALEDVAPEAVRRARVELLRTGTIEGRIETGGVEGVQVVVRAGGQDGSVEAFETPAPDGTYALRWLAPGEKSLGLVTPLGPRPAQPAEVHAGERTRVDLLLEPAVVAGPLAGTVESESGAYDGQILVFLLDGEGAVLGVFPCTWRELEGERRAPFRFDAAPEGPLTLGVISLGSRVAARIEPRELRTPLETVEVLLLDASAGSEWAFDVRAAEDGAALELYEVVLRPAGGLAQSFTAAPPDDAAAGPDGWPAARPWTLVAGGLRWNRTLGATPLRGLAAEPTWTFEIRAPGRRPATGGPEHFEHLAPGRRLALVSLEPL